VISILLYPSLECKRALGNRANQHDNARQDRDRNLIFNNNNSIIIQQ